MTTAAVQRQKLGDGVVESLLGAIQGGELLPGARLPPERALALSLGVSRTSLRDGLRRLELLGCLDVRPGGGTFIRLPDPAVVGLPFRGVLAGIPQSARDLLEFRRLLEPEVAALAAQRATGAQVALLRASLERQSKALEQGLKLAPEDLVFHQLIAEIAGNSVILKVLETLRHLLRHLREQALNEGGPEQTVAEHLEIVGAVARRDPERARAGMILHLNTVIHGAGSPVEPDPTGALPESPSRRA